MPQQTLDQFYAWIRRRLAQKAYAEIGPVQPLDLAFFKHGALNLPYVIAVIDIAHISNTPTEIFKRVEQWFQQLHGQTGAGCLLFVYHITPAVTRVEEIQKISGYVIAGAHDLHTGRHWLSNHLGWEQEIYGE
jgi:hypothetical protein